MKGKLNKMMSAVSKGRVSYQLPLSGDLINLDHYIGKTIKIFSEGEIFCQNCQRKTKKSYHQGYCYPCSLKLAACDLCILKPELCHFEKGTCREPEWGKEHCFRPHVIYLANSSGLKVGITRKINIPFRWIDQGASWALPLVEVKDRLSSGKIEVLLKSKVSDKTDWRKMLKGVPEEIDLQEWKKKILDEFNVQILEYGGQILIDAPVYRFHYPVEKYPEKIKSLSLDKISQFTSKLIGIKGQYLIFEEGVFNVRTHTGYEIDWEVVEYES